MKDVKQNDKTSTSMSKARKIARKKEIEQMRRNAKLSKILSICVIAVVAVGIVSLIGYNIYRNNTTIKPSSDYSAALTENGLIDGVTATSYLDLGVYSNITVPLSEVEYSDESVETDIQTLLKDYDYLDLETDAVIADGDKVNIDYVGSVNGVEFEGGNSEGEGYDLEIGSNSFIDDFEAQLIGYSIGDEATVEVTFPEDYTNADMAGKEAVFEVVINGIYVSPEFTDEFVKENLSEFASTTTEYKEYIKQTKYEENLTTWLSEYMTENTTVSSYPKEYISHLKSIKKYEDQSSYEYMNQLYSSMGYAGFSSFENYVDMSEAKYDASLAESVQATAKESLIYQAIAELEGITVSEADYTSDDYDTRVEQYGKGYVMQELVKQKVIQLLKENSTVK